jgi:hypothetical protein
LSSKGGLDPAFENVAFELETSTTGNPKYAEVKTAFGSSPPLVFHPSDPPAEKKLALFHFVPLRVPTLSSLNPKYAEVKTAFGYHIIMVEGRK